MSSENEQQDAMQQHSVTPPAVSEVSAPPAAPTQMQQPGVAAPQPGVGVPPAPPMPPAPQLAPQPGVGVPPSAPLKQKAPRSAKQLPTFLKVSIVLLAVLAIASISLLFVGDFEGKFERIFATFIGFAIFVALTTLDSRWGQKNEWYQPVALIANSYILALLLIVTWMTPAGWELGFVIFWKSLAVILITRAVVACAQFLLNVSVGKPKPLNVFALLTSLMATIAGILFTAPVAIEVFDVEIPELYWKFSVAALLLTALGLAITVLLRWAYGAPEREARMRQAEAERLRQLEEMERARLAQYQLAGAAPQLAAGIAESPIAPAPPTALTPAATEPAPLLPWPTFPDGTPLPQGADGQPDFSALNR